MRLPGSAVNFPGSHKPLGRVPRAAVAEGWRDGDGDGDGQGSAGSRILLGEHRVPKLPRSPLAPSDLPVATQALVRTGRAGGFGAQLPAPSLHTQGAARGPRVHVRPRASPARAAPRGWEGSAAGTARAGLPASHRHPKANPQRSPTAEPWEARCGPAGASTFRAARLQLLVPEARSRGSRRRRAARSLPSHLAALLQGGTASRGGPASRLGGACGLGPRAASTPVALPRVVYAAQCTGG